MTSYITYDILKLSVFRKFGEGGLHFWEASNGLGPALFLCKHANNL